MTHPLLGRDRTDELPADYLAQVGEVFMVFDKQDSGNVSYGVALPDGRFFVKTAGDPLDPRPYSAHPVRVERLRNAARLATEVRHPAMPAFHRLIESPTGPMLVYGWADGELLHVSREQRHEPDSPLQRFRELSHTTIARALDTVFDLIHTLAGSGWIASDFYDGCLIYDFDKEHLTIVDLDETHEGAFVNEMGRMFGSTRFMAPEEFELGATIDERTTVFTMGRTMSVFLSDGSLARAPFRGDDPLYEVMVRACQDDPTDRFPSVAKFVLAWERAHSPR